MKRFNPNRLPALTKSVYVSQQKWVEKNWKDTLKDNEREIERLLNKVCVFDIWKSALDNKFEVSKIMMPEIFMEANLSVHYACMGLYKQAHACLRAQLETTLRLVYFSTHSVEFGWWQGGKEKYFIGKQDVWADSYQYFKKLEEVINFQRKCKENGDSFDLFKDVGRLYGKLSSYVHSGKVSFQTTPDRFSPKYKKSNFNIWAKSFLDCQKYINAILILGFSKDFKIIGLNNKKDILRVVEERKYKRGLRASLNLKFRGRI